MIVWAGAGVPAAVALLLTLASTPAVSTAEAEHSAHSVNRNDPMVGRLAYVTNDQRVLVVGVRRSGATSSPQRIGPVTQAHDANSVYVGNLVVSGDGRRVAWSEALTAATRNGQQVLRRYVVLRNMRTGRPYRHVTADRPIGFAGHRLLLTTRSGVKRLVTAPSVQLRDTNISDPGLAAYRRGAVTVHTSMDSDGRTTERLLLTTVHGGSTALHTYRHGSHSQRSLNAGGVSGDASRVVVERGNHDDFRGVGRSSTADEYIFLRPHPRKRLGHYGGVATGWRLQTATFVGKRNRVWAAWTAASDQRVRTVVARAGKHHSWGHAYKRAITATGNADGFLVVQPGRYVAASTNPYRTHFMPVSTAGARLVRGRTSHRLAVQGTAFVWVAPPRHR